MVGSDFMKGIGVFALVVVVIIAGTAAVGTVSSGESEPSVQPTASAFDTESLLPTAVAADGRVKAPGGGSSKTIVIDASHGNTVETSKIQPLVDALTRAGHEVRLATGGGSSGLSGFAGGTGSTGLNATLQSADAFIVISPSSAYTTDEINGVEAFADAGGRVLLLADPIGQSASGTAALPIPIGVSTGTSATPGQPSNLAARFGIAFGSGYLYNMSDNANNFQSVYASAASDDPLAANANRLVFRDATPLTISAGGTPLVTSEAQLSSTRQADTYTVATRTGNVTAIGDTDFLSPASATVGDNDRFIGNLASFLVSGEKTSGVPSPVAGESPAGTPGFPGSGTPTLPPEQSQNTTTTIESP